MARAGVTYHDIAKAAESIKALGQEPTVDRVREQLGTGSKSTIAPLLKRWRSTTEEAPEENGLPSDLLDIVKSLHERVQHIADQRIDQAQQVFDQQNDEFQKTLSDTKSKVAQLETTQKELNERVGELTNEVGQTSQELELTQGKLIKTEFQKDEAITRVIELKETVTELKQENKDIREHFNHYQQHIAEDRQLEREQFHSVNQGLKDQILNLQHRLNQSESNASKLLAENVTLQNNVNKLEQSNSILSSDLNGKTDELQSLKRNYDAALRDIQEYRHTKEKLAEEIAVLRQQKADADTRVAVLSQVLDTSQAEFKAFQNKITFLTNENKVILQEKAMIQGQLKQIQSAL